MTARLRHITRRLPCESPWTELSTGCYMFHETKMSQNDAKKFCEQVNSHLVEINSEEENTAIRDEIDRRGFKSRKIEFWLGITDRHSEGTWVLESNGESLLFSDWDTGEPNNARSSESCAHLNSHLKWNDRPCDDVAKNGYIWSALCEI